MVTVISLKDYVAPVNKIYPLLHVTDTHHCLHKHTLLEPIAINQQPLIKLIDNGSKWRALVTR